MWTNTNDGTREVMSDKTTRTFEVEVTSPFGTQAIEEFHHHLNKIKSDAKSRWGIDITITEVGEEPEHTEGFE